MRKGFKHSVLSKKRMSVAKMVGSGTGQHWRRLARKKVLSFGYSLSNEEEVHHIDGNPQNSNINNLVVFKNTNEHMKWHRNNCDKFPNEDGCARLLLAVGAYHLIDKIIKTNK